MAKVLIFLLMEMFTQVNTKKASLMEKVNMPGEMARHIWESLKMG